MSVFLIEAAHDENRKARGGQPGDQLDEVRVLKWYERTGGWDVCLECTEPLMAKKAAGIFSQIAIDSSFGYDQDQRWTALEAIRKAGSIEAAAPSEIDCSSGIDISYILAGLNVEKGYTGNLERRYLATGKFIAHREPKYLTSGNYAKVGWLYLTAGKHVAMMACDGPYASSTVNGTPKPTSDIQKIKQLSNIQLPYVEAVRNVRVRVGPSTKEASVGYISVGTKLHYIDSQTKNDKKWYRVDTSKGVCFVSADPMYTKLVVS